MSLNLSAALEELHLDCWGWALACCGRDRQRAHDALQLAYLRILEGKARFRGASSFRTFVFGVIRMTAREEMRGVRELRIEATSPFEQLVDTAPLPDAATLAAERRTHLLQALARLSERQREVIELVFYHDMTIEEAAGVMRVRVGSARTHYARGKARLRAMLEDVKA